MTIALVVVSAAAIVAGVVLFPRHARCEQDREDAAAADSRVSDLNR